MYLWQLAVSPREQRSGVGRTLMARVLEDAAQLELPTYLETANPANVPYYRSFGFVEIGRDNYHAEAIFAREGRVKIFTLGKDETRIQPVEAQTLEAYARLDGGTEDVAVELFPQPQKTDPAGKVSLFVGRLPEEMWGKAVTLTVPITVNGEGFRFRISSKPAELLVGTVLAPCPGFASGAK